MLRIIGTIFAALLGLCFGSFLNVCLSRWPAGESVVHPRSHCRACGRTLAWWENVPLVSWVALRGRCRGCGVWIRVRYPLVEAAVGVTWALMAWKSWKAFLPVEYAAGMMFFLWLLIGLAVLDSEYLWLPDAMTLTGIGVGFLWWLIQGEQVGWALHVPSDRWGDAKGIGMRLLAIAISATIILIIRWIYWLIRRREGMGLGDAKLMAMLAAWLGLEGALLSLFLGVVLGAVYAVGTLMMRSRRGEGSWATAQLPLGTFLCIGGIVSALWGQSIIGAYLRLFP
ncbi:prepilin peptidase [Occallatibacter riparius]|uniref:Prepilin peptidase n=1 Tax=Occallatibacter riparius TaxID=1002689 RepID=A0A9J7BNL5_9BACT|nr:A24 family peptidase [Occallatibacter riparius]UWZ82757.1 prepilin peptidase [Occallatibacter riparius]